MDNILAFGSKQIKYQLIHSDRKSLGISVTPELNVIVKAPLCATAQQIELRMRKRAPWILKQLNYFNSFLPRPAQKILKTGETYYLLGKQITLKVSIGKKTKTNYKGRVIEITVKKKSEVAIVLQNWYKQTAKQKFSDIAEPLIQRFKKYNVEPTAIYVQDMKKRWGSCSLKGRITLNTDLIKAPKACVEYVIIHELCHLVYHNHSSKFSALLHKEMPDWEKWRNKLEEFAE